jgi:hypothetical protein
MKISSYYTLSGEVLNTTSAFTAGIECEIEGVVGTPCFDFFDTTKDGSLRHEGLEFISEPLGKEALLTAFTTLHDELELFEVPEGNFSPRTSTHVHINCRPLEEEQVKTLLLLYALYEEYFFLVVSPARRGNIHCVPLTETHLPGLYHTNLSSLVNRWHKYTALNLVPLCNLGTVEFRHLQGTGDPVVLGEWLTCLERLWELCQRTTLTADSLSSTATLEQWYTYIFGHSEKMRAMTPTLPSLISNTLIDVKFALI